MSPDKRRPDGFDAASPKPWIEKAQGDLRTARRELQASIEPNYDAAAFHAQQAVEKLMKAVIVRKGARPRKIHDLVVLSTDLKDLGVPFTWPLDALAALSLAAIDARYPSMRVEPDDARSMVEIAEAIWAALRPMVDE